MDRDTRFRVATALWAAAAVVLVAMAVGTLARPGVPVDDTVANAGVLLIGAAASAIVAASVWMRR